MLSVVRFLAPRREILRSRTTHRTPAGRARRAPDRALRAEVVGQALRLGLSRPSARRPPAGRGLPAVTGHAAAP